MTQAEMQKKLKALAADMEKLAKEPMSNDVAKGLNHLAGHMKRVVQECHQQWAIDSAAAEKAARGKPA